MEQLASYQNTKNALTNSFPWWTSPDFRLLPPVRRLRSGLVAEHGVPALVAPRLLKPLGNPPPNGIKFFAAAELLELTQDHNWLVRITSTVNLHWQKKNAAKKNRPLLSPTNGNASEFNLPTPMVS